MPCHKALQCFPVPLTHSLDQLERGLHSGREALPGGSPGESRSLGIRISDERVRQFRDSTPSDTEANVRSRAGRPATLRNGAVRISPPGREHTPDAGECPHRRDARSHASPSACAFQSRRRTMAQASHRRTRGAERVQNVSKTPGDSRGMARTPVYAPGWLIYCGSNACHQKLRAITKLEKLVNRVRSPSPAPPFARVSGEGCPRWRNARRWAVSKGLRERSRRSGEGGPHPYAPLLIARASPGRACRRAPMCHALCTTGAAMSANATPYIGQLNAAGTIVLTSSP